MILAASDFVTAFEIARGSNGVFADEVFRLLIGVAALIGGMTALVLNWENKSVKSWVGPVFAIAWALFGATCTIFLICLDTLMVWSEHIGTDNIKSLKGRSKCCMNSRRQGTPRETLSL